MNEELIEFIEEILSRGEITEKCMIRCLKNYQKKRRLKYMERRLSKKDLMELYGVDRVTIEDWRRTKGLKMIEITSHSKYILKNDLIEWEEGLRT